MTMCYYDNKANQLCSLAPCSTSHSQCCWKWVAFLLYVQARSTAEYRCARNLVTRSLIKRLMRTLFCSTSACCGQRMTYSVASAKSRLCTLKISGHTMCSAAQFHQLKMHLQLYQRTCIVTLFNMHFVQERMAPESWMTCSFFLGGWGKQNIVYLLWCYVLA